MAISVADMPRIRAQLQGELTAEKRAVSLKHADDQSVTALIAMRSASEHLGTPDMSTWGVLAAPRTMGRHQLESALERFEAEGAWGVSPNIIPNYSLHALAGFLSVAMSIHGPNLGVGGLSGCEGDIWPVASSWLSDKSIPAVWIVLTGRADSTCRANVILAQRADQLVKCTMTYFLAGQSEQSLVSPFTVESFDQVVERGTSTSSRMHWSLPGGASLEWQSGLSDSIGTVG